MGTAGAVAGSSMTCWEYDGQTSQEGAVSNAGTSGTRGNKVGDASHASEYTDGADTGTDSFHRGGALLSLFVLLCSRLKTIFFTDAGHQR